MFPYLPPFQDITLSLVQLGLLFSFYSSFWDSPGFLLSRGFCSALQLGFVHHSGLPGSATVSLTSPMCLAMFLASPLNLVVGLAPPWTSLWFSLLSAPCWDRWPFWLSGMLPGWCVRSCASSGGYCHDGWPLSCWNTRGLLAKCVLCHVFFCLFVFFVFSRVFAPPPYLVPPYLYTPVPNVSLPLSLFILVV